MSKTLKTIGMIAGAVALTAATAGAFAGAAAPILGTTLGTINTVATAISAAATVGAQVTAKAPAARGTVTQMLISPDPPHPYLMGEGYYGGVLRHDAAYGATLKDVPNPYRGMVVVYSGGGPIQSITPMVDKAAVTSWYSGFLYTDTQLGTTPESSALAPHYAGLPGWDSSSKLSGQAAILWNLLFDKKGKRFASGVPIIGAHGQWVKAYDPRLDSTFPGGSGSHVLGDESTYTWTENPALHFGTYAYGRYQNGKRTIGCGLRSIDWGVIAAWANVCDANDWTIFGVVYEPGNRWDNLKDIAAAGGGLPVVSSGGKLSVKYWAPQVALDTITMADLAEGQVQYSPLQSWDDRVNTIIPRYTSEDHEWNQVAAQPVAIAGFVTEDGEEKRKEWPYNLVKQAGQAAQLAAYQIYEGRETSPIVIPCLPRLRAYRPGECLTLDLPEYGLETDAIILTRTLDPATMTVTLTLIGETPAKHAGALGQTPAPPATPVAGQDGEDRDETTDGVNTNAPRVVANEAAMLALDVPTGTFVKLADTGRVYYYNGGTSGTIADWTLIATTAAVTAGTVSFTPAGSIAATNVQAAFEEMDSEKASLGGAAFTGAVSVAGAFSCAGSATIGDNVSDSHTVNGNMTILESAGNALILKDSNGTGTSVSIALAFVGSDDISVASIGMNSTGDDHLYITSVSGDVRLNAANSLSATISTTGVNLASGKVLLANGIQVVGARKTGWATATGIATRTTFDTATVTTAQLAQRVKALIDDLHNTAGHGLIGT